jgi:hypothetical protein
MPVVPGNPAADPVPRRADVVRRLRGIEAWQRDVIAVLTRPAVVGEFRVRLDAAARRVGQADGPKLTWTHLFIKAAALAAVSSPALHRMYGPFGVLEPGHADVGVSVEGQEPCARPIARAWGRLPRS